VKAVAAGIFVVVLIGGCRQRAETENRGQGTGSREQGTDGGGGGGGGGEWSCGGVHGDARVARRMGSGERLRLGAVADVHGDVEGAKRAAALLRGQGLDGVVALGDLADTANGVTEVLAALGAAGVPVLALAGEAESEEVFQAGVKGARARGVDVVDLVDVRVVDAGAAVVVAVPGYRYTQRGCRYRVEDLQQLKGFVGRAPKPVVFVAHGVPRDEGAEGIDWGFGDANVGDPAMRELVQGMAPVAALFAHVDEAGGRQRGEWVNVGQRLARVEVESGRATVTVLP
jgi:Icc-related predicted phosphoesterase